VTRCHFKRPRSVSSPAHATSWTRDDGAAMRQSVTQRPLEQRLTTVVEVACVVVVIAAVLALLVWIAFHHGGGVLNQG
jgi:hypothetical protein